MSSTGHHAAATKEYLVFVYKDPTGELGDDEVDLLVQRDKLTFRALTMTMDFEWSRVLATKAVKPGDADELDLLIIRVDGAGQFIFEVDNALDIRRACHDCHPALLITKGWKSRVTMVPLIRSNKASKANKTKPTDLLHTHTTMNALTKKTILENAER